MMPTSAATTTTNDLAPTSGPAPWTAGRDGSAKTGCSSIVRPRSQRPKARINGTREPSLRDEPPEDRDRVLAAEAEAVDHRRVDLRLALHVGHVVEVAVRIRLVVVDRR